MMGEIPEKYQRNTREIPRSGSSVMASYASCKALPRLKSKPTQSGASKPLAKNLGQRNASNASFRPSNQAKAELNRRDHSNGFYTARPQERVHYKRNAPRRNEGAHSLMAKTHSETVKVPYIVACTSHQWTIRCLSPTRNPSSRIPALEICIIQVLFFERRKTHVLVDPIQHSLMPNQPVLRLDHPMTLIRKHKEPARHTPRLKNIKRSETLGDRNTIVLLAMNYKLRSRPLAHMRTRFPPTLLGHNHLFELRHPGRPIHLVVMAMQLCRRPHADRAEDPTKASKFHFGESPYIPSIWAIVSSFVAEFSARTTNVGTDLKKSPGG
jgi:hypothetical protein